MHHQPRGELGLGPFHMRRYRPPRWTVTAVLLAVGVLIAFPAFEDDNPTGPISFAAALPCWLLALGRGVFRAPDPDLPDGLRRRRLHRRICWRGTLVLFLLASLALLACAYWGWQRDYGPVTQQLRHPSLPADVSGTLALWLMLLAPLPGMLDAPSWRLRPAPVRRAAVLGGLEEALGRPARFRALPEEQRPEPGFDPALGWLGRPRPVFARAPEPRPDLRPEPRPEPPPELPLTVRPSSPLRRGGRGGERPRFPAWQRFGAISWDGRALFFTDARCRRLRVPVADAAELVRVSESHESGPTELLMLLDPHGRQLLRLPATGFDRQQLAELAAAAGLPFACYQLGNSDESGILLHPVLFPPRRGAPVLRIR